MPLPFKLKDVNVLENQEKGLIDAVTKRIYDYSKEGGKLSYEQTLDIVQDLMSSVLVLNKVFILEDTTDERKGQEINIPFFTTISDEYPTNELAFHINSILAKATMLMSSWNERNRILEIGRDEFDKRSISIHSMIEFVESEVDFKFILPEETDNGLYASNIMKVLMMTIIVSNENYKITNTEELITKIFNSHSDLFNSFDGALLFIAMNSTYDIVFQTLISKQKGGESLL